MPHGIARRSTFPSGVRSDDVLQLRINPQRAAACALANLLTAGLHDDLAGHSTDAAQRGFIGCFDFEGNLFRVLSDLGEPRAIRPWFRSTNPQPDGTRLA